MDLESSSSGETESEKSVDLEKLKREFNGETSPTEDKSSDGLTEINSQGSVAPSKGKVSKHGGSKNGSARNAQDVRDSNRRMEQEAEMQFERLKDSHTMIKNQAV